MLSSAHAWGAEDQGVWGFPKPSANSRGPPPWALLSRVRLRRARPTQAESSSSAVWFAAACGSRSLAGETALQKGTFRDAEFCQEAMSTLSQAGVTRTFGQGMQAASLTTLKHEFSRCYLNPRKKTTKCIVLRQFGCLAQGIAW